MVIVPSPETHTGIAPKEYGWLTRVFGIDAPNGAVAGLESRTLAWCGGPE